jgi:fructoselysine-6-P-deglycase FrlB-like protein
MVSTYHMGEYIREGPDALRRTLEANRREVQSLARELHPRLRRIVLTGVGSSYTAAMMALPVFHECCRVPT